MKNCELRIADYGLMPLCLWAVALFCVVSSARASTTNSVATTNAPAAAMKTNAITGNDFPSFKIISQRNIFSANRSGRVSSSGPTSKPTKVDTFTLVGTVDYSKGQYAIFDGSSSSFRKTVTIGDSLAGFTIEDIDLNQVTISATNGTQTVLHVGSQMRRVDDGSWAPGSGSSPSVARSSNSADSGDEASPKGEPNSESSDEPAPSAADNDVLKKLMQKRKAEVKNESE